jgi:hypothetical protein
MNTAEDSKWRLRTFGMIWIALAPILFVMAGISSVHSEVTYRLQLAVFSAVALAGITVGIGGIFHRMWAATGMLVLSWLGAIYFLGSALLILLWPAIPGVKAAFHPVMLLASLGIAPVGVPFILMARSLRAVIKNESA